MFGNLTVIGTASFTYTTASQTLLNQNTISTFATSPASPKGGYKVVDSASQSVSSSFLYDIDTKEWTLDRPLVVSGSVNISGSFLINGQPLPKGGASVTISGSVPSGSKDSGSLWWNETDGNLYVQIVTPTGSTYVPATNTVAGGNYGATYVFSGSGATWTINHNLGTRTPLITVYSGSSVMIPASIVSPTAQTTVVTFSGSVAGTAILSTGIGNANIKLSESASVATSASFASSALSSSFTTTSSFAATARSASFATTASFAASASLATRTRTQSPTGWQLYSVDTNMYNIGSQNLWASSPNFTFLSGSNITFVIPAGFTSTKVVFDYWNWGDAGSNNPAVGSLRYSMSSSLLGGNVSGLGMASWSNPIAGGVTTRFNANAMHEVINGTPGTYTVRLGVARESEAGGGTGLVSWNVGGRVEVYVQQ
jgi:hypothetical protein